MGKPIDKHAQKILEELNLNPKDCLWDCHGAWVMYHRYVEQAGIEKGISINAIEVVEANSKDGIAVVKCIASKGDVSVTTFGESSPKNNRNPYPFAMAEKRAIDRAFLKLLGLHGFIYAEDEMDVTSSDKPKLNGSKRLTTPERSYCVYNNSGEKISEFNTFQSYINHLSNLDETSLAINFNREELKKHKSWIESKDCKYPTQTKKSALERITDLPMRLEV